MVRVLALVEGPTEREFGRTVLAPHLGELNVAFHPRVIGKSGHKGGVGNWERAKREIIALLKQERESIVTTMFDLNGMPMNWPGRSEARSQGRKGAAAAGLIEEQIQMSVTAEVSDLQSGNRFVPYLSVHEFEAVLFSDPEILADVLDAVPNAFSAVLREFGECEQINERPGESLSHRISRISRRYEKTADGIIAAQRIGISVIREKCPHFHQWITRLEMAGAPTS